MSDYRITASWDTLLEQSQMTAKQRFTHAVNVVDDYYGKGFSKTKNGILLTIAIMNNSHQDFALSSWMISKQDDREKEPNEILKEISANLGGLYELIEIFVNAATNEDNNKSDKIYVNASVNGFIETNT